MSETDRVCFCLMFYVLDRDVDRARGIVTRTGYVFVARCSTGRSGIERDEEDTASDKAYQAPTLICFLMLE